MGSSPETAGPHLGFLACDSSRADADDRDSWLIVVVGGVLTEVLCPRCRR
jgi:hypothetical protein